VGCWCVGFWRLALVASEYCGMVKTIDRDDGLGVSYRYLQTTMESGQLEHSRVWTYSWPPSILIP